MGARRDSLMPSEWSLIPDLFRAARYAKERAAVFVPILTWQSVSGEAGFVMVPSEGGTMSATLDDLLDSLYDTYGPPAWFAVTVDAYGRIASLTDGIDPMELADRFSGGDMGVVEQLMILLGGPGQVSAWRQVYRRTPVDGWEWDDPQFLAHPVLPEGGVLEVVQRHCPEAQG